MDVEKLLYEICEDPRVFDPSVDLVETGIHYAAIYQGESGCSFRGDLFEQYPDVYQELTGDELMKNVIRVFDFGDGGAILYSELKSSDCFLGII